jgi:hypothetical protein
MGFSADQYLLFCELTYPLRWTQASSPSSQYSACIQTKFHRRACLPVSFSLSYTEKMQICHLSLLPNGAKGMWYVGWVWYQALMGVIVVTYHVVVRGTFGEDIGERRSVRLRQDTHELYAHAMLQPTKHIIFRNCSLKRFRNQCKKLLHHILVSSTAVLYIYICRGLCINIKIHRTIILPFVLYGRDIWSLALMER